VKVAVVAQPDYAYARGVLRGVAEYSAYGALAPVWVNSVYRPLPNLRDGQIQGVIAMLTDPALVEQLQAFQLPLLNVSERLELPRIPLVTMDNQAVGGVAARHLVERGVTDWAYVGPAGHRYAEKRRDGFVAELERLDKPCRVFMVPPDQSNQLSLHLRTWIKRLSPPLGIMTCNDQWAVFVVEACQSEGLRIPGDVAVVGSDNDDLYCLLSQPTISSVYNNYQMVGREAARLMEAWLTNGKIPPKQTLIPPGHVVIRRSSDLALTPDPLVNEAMRLIGERAIHGLTVDKLLEDLPVGRRKLEKNFKEVLGRLPATESRRVQVERAKQLLLDTSLTLDEVAEAAGLGSQRQLRMLFRRELGASPSVFRSMFEATEPSGETNANEETQPP
jgi:LacI family transcriptional regulator